MRKKLTATICVFSGFLICVSMLISSVLAATTATATITASVTYTPAIQAKIWISDGTNEVLIFNNTSESGTPVASMDANGIISLANTKLNNSESGTTFTITVQNFSKGIDGNNETSDGMYFGLFVGGNTEISVITKDPDTQETITTTTVPVTDGDFVTSEIRDANDVLLNPTTIEPEQNDDMILYDGNYYVYQSVAASATVSLKATPTIVVPGTIEFSILLFDSST